MNICVSYKISKNFGVENAKKFLRSTRKSKFHWQWKKCKRYLYHKIRFVWYVKMSRSIEFNSSMLFRFPDARNKESFILKTGKDIFFG